MYAMVCWLTDVYNNDREQNIKAGITEEGLSFEDFIQ